MPNALLTAGVPVIVLDTAGATSLISDALRISSIVWDSGANGAVGNTVLLHDAASGNVVFQATLAVAKNTIIWSPARPVHVKGLYLTTIDNGTLLIYVC